MQKDMLNNWTMLLYIGFAIYTLYICNSSKKYKMRKHFELVLSNTNVHSKQVHNDQRGLV